MADTEHRDVSGVERGLAAPRVNLKINVATWPAGQRIYRIHSDKFTALQFNPGMGNARFSPMLNGVATLYGGATTGVAVMETLFHDVPLHSDGKPFDLRRAQGLVHSVISATTDLTLADFNPKTLRKMGVRRADLLDSSADHYPFTREYSLAVHRAYPDVHGLQWSSRQHGGQAVMLFGDRIAAGQLGVEIESQRLLESDLLMESIEEEADQLGIVLLEPGGGQHHG